MYINSELIKEASCKQYPTKVEFEENSVGCGISMEYIGKEGEERLEHNFHGEMSAVYFIEVSTKNLKATHEFLSQIYGGINLSELIPILAYKQEIIKKLLVQSKNSPKEIVKVGLIERIFTFVAPSCSKKTYKSNTKFFLCASDPSKNYREIYNHIERIYNGTKAHYNVPGQKAFLILGGFKLILPLISTLADSSSKNTKFMYDNNF